MPTEMNTKDLMKEYFAMFKTPQPQSISIKKVIFNGPATIVIWSDGVKTVVKCCDGDEAVYSREAGIALCCMKRMFGNDNAYHKVFKDWCGDVSLAAWDGSLENENDADIFMNKLRGFCDILKKGENKE